MPQNPSIWMWAEACQLLDRAERLHSQFFRPARDLAQSWWEPPIDVHESDSEIVIEIALPGVRPSEVTAGFDGGALIVTGVRHLRQAPEGAVIRRLELPHGRFARRIPLAAGRYELSGREHVDGLLVLRLRKLGERGQS